MHPENTLFHPCRQGSVKKNYFYSLQSFSYFKLLTLEKVAAVGRLMAEVVVVVFLAAVVVVVVLLLVVVVIPVVVVVVVVVPVVVPLVVLPFVVVSSMKRL